VKRAAGRVHKGSLSVTSLFKHTIIKVRGQAKNWGIKQ